MEKEKATEMRERTKSDLVRPNKKDNQMLFYLKQQQRMKKDKCRFRGQDKRTKIAIRFATRASSVE